MGRLPHVILGGAPKCGTSSLFRWLTDHPSVAAADAKETFFFMDRGHSLEDRRGGFHAAGLAAYGEHFSTQAPILAEGTTHYLYQRTALEQIPALETEPMVVFVVRDPVQRLRSSFSYTKHTLGRMDEPLDYATYVEALLAGDHERIRSVFSEPRDGDVLAADLEYGRYVRFLRKWREALPGDRLRVFSFDELKAEPRSLLTALTASMGLDGSFYRDYRFAAANETYATSWPRLHSFARRLTRRAKIRERWRGRLRAMYWRVQGRRPVPKAELPEPLEKRLRDAYDRDDRALQAEFGIDVSGWASQRSTVNG